MKMDKRIIHFLFAVVLLLVTPSMASAQSYRGVAVSTKYPSIVTASRDLIVFDLKFTDYDMKPQRVNIRLQNNSAGWDSSFVGGGGIIDAVFVAPDEPATAQLWLAPDQKTPAGSYDFVVSCQGSFGRSDLPLTVTIGDKLPQRIEIKPELPELLGSPTADFTFTATITNRSANESAVRLRAETPEGFDVTFKKKYGSGEMTAIPIEAGKNEQVEIKVKPPQDIQAGNYPVRVVADTGSVSAFTDLNLQISGQPKISLTGPEGRLSESAVAGKERALKLELKNSGSADAKNIKLSSTSPNNWKVVFEPNEIDTIPAGEKSEVTALITPSSEAIAGDYSVTMRARGDDINASEQFRIAVKTSALWGVVALIIIGLALLIVIFSMKRFGRR